MSEFQEKYNICLDRFSSGSTTTWYTKWYDMQKYRRVDFIVSGQVKLAAPGAAGATDYQLYNLAVYQATSVTGGGSSALASATATIGKNTATGIGTAAKCREGYILFGALDKATDIELTINEAVFTSSSDSTVANSYVVKGASAAATVASEAFAAMFNSASNNTATAITANWIASTDAGDAIIRITPRDPDSTFLLAIGTTGGTMVGVGGAFQGHIGVDRQFLSKRYVALGLNSTEHANPCVVQVIREADNGPTTSVGLVSRSMSASTRK